ncbi:accessory Sec system protein Asp3 [Streptococcus pseudoporcinus]|uniref:Accessory Sec system protein Asp3 n=1 Tax=Streptococcus pseudoporcinus LQ 940-04 TaxID=875093 RepID=G5K931_9STRE|nr:accessory Sec system protein Asp3 [Streptococcus pseudoporcinus]EFR44397.1 accessory Sec system protein Asp3 [Streptococcus pseudoporcinus SPIN 20026]EHI64147.1 accessory Sec system protein Asp3 [Streptococcus pseudoporcinus LQ 940-04]VEF93506.1 accessory secretory protein asp3 [Streptococcus pseudoporcinus]
MQTQELEVFLINWGLLHQGTYMYGVDLSYLRDGRISYRQDYLPIGTVIHSWYSQTNFQANRDVPRLPILKRGIDYRLKLNIETNKGHVPYLRLTFFNRRKEIVAYKIIKEDSADFSLPEETFSYQIDLINAGCQDFIFDSILLYNKASQAFMADAYVAINALNHESLAVASELIVFLLENKDGQLMPQSLKSLNQLGNVLVMGVTQLNHLSYLGDKFVNFVAQTIYKEAPDFLDKGIHFIGTGPKSDCVVILMEDAFEQGKATCSGYPDFDKELMSDIESLSNDLERVKELLEVNNHFKAKPFIKSEQQDDSFALVEGLLRPHHYLAKLSEKN